MISSERLERYSDFVDPERTGTPYDPKQGLERLIGVLSPDPKGITLAAMGEEWYGSETKLQSGVFVWLRELGLPYGIWPIKARSSIWMYCQYKYENGEIEDGSLVHLGAVVKKIEQDPFQVLYSRSLAGAELAVPLVQQAVRFVSKAREYAEAQRLQGKPSPKFDSMWRILSSVSSKTDQRRPLAVWSVIDFLVHNQGKHKQIDLSNEINIPTNRLSDLLPSLGSRGIIDYTSLTEVGGRRIKGLAVFRLVDRESVIDLDPDKIYQDIRDIRRNFYERTRVARVIDYIKKHPDDEYRALGEQFGIDLTHHIGTVLSSLTDLRILQRLEPGFRGKVLQSSASANDLTHLFYDLVCAPAKEVADTLSPLPLKRWDRTEVAIYLQNYNEERSQIGPQGGEDARRLLLDILSQNEGEMKLSHITDLYNNQSNRELRTSSLKHQLKRLLESGKIEESKSGYYRLARK